MSLLFRIAFLNLWRRMSRSVLVILMVGMSITGLLLMQGVFEGMINQMIDNSLRSDTGHISIYNKEYRTSKSLDDQIPNPKEVISFIKKQSEVDSFIERVIHEGLVATAKHSQGATIIGTNLEDENYHAHLKNYLTEGEYTFGKLNKGALIGAELADKLKVSIGKKIVITVQDVHKEINSISLKVTGIVRTNNVKIDKSGVIIDEERLKQLSGLDDKATQISLFVSNKDAQIPLVEKINSEFGNTQINAYHWKKIFPMFEQYEGIEVAFYAISYFLIFIVAALGIFGVILVSVLERVREFGIMLAIGSSFSRVRFQIILESMLLGLMGLLSGSIIGGALLYYFATTGIDLSSYSEAMNQFGMDAVIKAEFEAVYFLYSSISVILATFFAALWPIRVLKKLHPIEAVNA